MKPIRWIAFICSILAMSITADEFFPEGEKKEYDMQWKPKVANNELASHKLSESDRIFSTDVYEAARFSFTPSHLAVNLAEFNQFLLRFHFDVVKGRTMPHVYVEVKETNRSAQNVEFVGFRYNNLISIHNNKRAIQVPIARKYMQRWWSVPRGERIEFNIDIEFGFVSNVKNISITPPLLVFSPLKASRKCHEQTCCHTKTDWKLTGKLYDNVVFPQGFRSRQCVDCIRSSEPPQPFMDHFLRIVHRIAKPEDLWEPAQLYQCQVTEWDSIHAKHVKANTTWEETYKEGPVPYFNAAKCKCSDTYQDDEFIDSFYN